MSEEVHFKITTQFPFLQWFFTKCTGRSWPSSHWAWRCSGLTPIGPLDTSMGAGEDSIFSAKTRSTSINDSSHYSWLMPLPLPVKEFPCNVEQECAFSCLPANWFIVGRTDFNCEASNKYLRFRAQSETVRFDYIGIFTMAPTLVGPWSSRHPVRG